jgi:hypothetical protein
VTVLLPALLTVWHTSFIELASAAQTFTVSPLTTSTVAVSLPELDMTDGKRSFDAGTYLSTSPMKAQPPCSNHTPHAHVRNKQAKERGEGSRE